jgi:predicted O-methyltransferase YrrM
MKPSKFSAFKEKFWYLLRYVHFQLTATHAGGHGVHSPFVYKFVRDLLEDRSQYYNFARIESYRKLLLKDTRVIEVQDFGAGSHKSRHRRVSQIAKNALIQRRFGELYFKMTDRFEYVTILELGSSLGVSTAYFALANSKARVFTIEGCPNTAALALSGFKKLGIENVSLNVGPIDSVLPQILQKLPRIDLVYFDANHRYEPTMKYFEACLPLVHSETVFVFDDINWSAEMRKAWQEITQHRKVVLTIDLFFVGLVFFRENTAKQNFIIKI